MAKKITFNNPLQLNPTNPPSRYSEEYSFNITIDPFKQNYITLKLNSLDTYTPIYLYIDGKQLGYAKCSDFEAINLCYGNFKPGGFFFVTSALPIFYTKGKKTITLSLRQAEPYDNLTCVNGRIYEIISTVSPFISLPENNSPVKQKECISYTTDEIAKFSDTYIQKQVNFFLTALQKLKQGEKLSITKYVEEFRHFCMILFEPYCPISDKAEAVKLILNCINLYVKDYFENPLSLLRTSHQSDWGGYYGELGQGLYIIEKLIDKSYLSEYLSTPFNEHMTKKEAWEICLKANFDFASARQSYIYNQTYYTYEGAWKAMAGLGVIESKYYIGKEKCDLILKEALGIAPWKGEHILTDENGRELDLYHCLFNHDKSAQFTDDFKNIVATGKALQKLDNNGDFVRRKPYGENYFPLSEKKLSRENGYVGNYGETCNYLPEWVYRTFNHGDEELSDLILKTALENINSRMYMRYEGCDDEGNRIMLLQQAIDERNPTMNPKSAYGTIINDKRMFLFASLLRHMEENERYNSSQWDKYKLYAKKALDALCQQYQDGHLSPVLETIGENYNDFRVDRTIEDIFSTEQKHLLPHRTENTDCFAFFDIDNLLLSLREKNTHIFAALNLRNRGYSGFGRAHIIKNNTHQLLQFKTEAQIETREKFIRQQNVNMDFIYDSSGSNSFFRAPEPLAEFGATPQALCGEEQSVTYQEGVGQVNRENFAIDTPYSGYPDCISAQIGDYLVICNTTRESYKNARDAIISVYRPGKFYDMITKKWIVAEKGKRVNFLTQKTEESPFGFIKIPPMTAYVLKCKKTMPLPLGPTVLNALENKKGVLLSWKESEGETYYVVRNFKVIAQTRCTTFLDTKVKKDSNYTYFVCSANEYGHSTLSPAVKIKAKKYHGLIKTSIGNAESSYDEKNSVLFIRTKNAHFGEGDDYKALERNISDSLPFAADSVSGAMSISASINREGILMARESLSKDARYASIGFEGSKIIIRTRSKNTIYNPNREKLSPLYYEFEKGNFTQLKLTVDKSLHSVLFYAKEKTKWVLLHREVLPLPKIYFMGLSTLSSASFKNVRIRKEKVDIPFSIRDITYETENDTVLFKIKKGLDNKYLIIEHSFDGKTFTTEKDDLVSESYKTLIKPFFRITPVNRHGVKGNSTQVKIHTEF